MNLLSKINTPLIWVVLASVIIFGYMRIDNLNNQVAYQEELNQSLIQDVSAIEGRYDRMETRFNIDLKEQRKVSQDLVDSFVRNRKQINDLHNTFNYSASGQRRDLERIAIGRPTLLERRINDATKEVGKEIENVTDYTIDIDFDSM